jgi:hypothetical protein
LTARRLVELGYVVSFPFFAKASYDLIADTGEKLVRVQIKTIYKAKTDNGIKWLMDFLKPRGITYKVEKYTQKDCDYIIGACPEKDICYVFPIQEVLERRQATFHFDEEEDHHMKSKSKLWADKYLESWF